MDFSTIDKSILEDVIRQVMVEKLGIISGNCDRNKEKAESGIMSIKVPNFRVTEANRMDTGKQSDIVYTRDFFTLDESPRLGAGIMEMKNTTFDWTLNYDEVDYVIEGHLDIITNGRKVSADAGEVILIPKGSSIQFSVPDYARFMYVTYPADWASQN